ncbi:MAG TPA: SpoIIE family protein phosphatase [Streptosporangiaceae bacterium]
MNDDAAVLLVVDDNDAKRYLITTWLRRAGHTVIEAATGAAALEMASQAELVLLDVKLPDINGYEVCRRIKANPATAATPVIQVSATATAVADRAHGLTQGADAYLAEPSEPDELLATVMAVLRYSRARHRAELTASQLAALTNVSLTINAARTFDGLARAAVTGAVTVFGVASVVVLLLPDGQLCRMSASPERPTVRRQGGRPELLDAVAKRLLGSREGSVAEVIDAQTWSQVAPGNALPGDVCVAVAKIKPDRPPVALGIAASAITGSEELQIIRQLAYSIALAVEAMRSYAEEHHMALTLQRSMLPTALPEVPGFSMSVRYVPASDRAEVGGDFYEALQWQDRLLIAIGDVEGHSLRAATVMGELRHALRAYACEGHAPLAITGLVNQALQHYYPTVIATLCLALLDPRTGELEVVNCGHLPPLLVSESGAAYQGEGGVMLGLPLHRPRSIQTVLPPGGTALLFTDGLIEDRRVMLDANLEKLRLAVQDNNCKDVESFSDHLLSLFGPFEDDVAMIALRRAAPL